MRGSVTEPAKRRVVVLSNWNIFSRLIASRLLSAADVQTHVIQITGDYHHRSGPKAGAALLRQMTLPYFVYKAFTTAFVHRLPFLPVQLPLAPSADGSQRQVQPELVAVSVKDPAIKATIQKIAPDILLSISCPQKIPVDLIRSARLAALNIHSSLLPRYAGLAPYFWVLRHGERTTGTTVHLLVEAFDKGDIVVQRELAIPERTSAFRLFLQLAELGRDCVAESVEGMLDGTLSPYPQRRDQHSYFSHPQWRDYVAMRRRGHRLIRFGDLWSRAS